MSYRVNWFETDRLIGTEAWDGTTLQGAKSRARALVAATGATRAEVCRPSGKVVFKHFAKLRN
jgi:hypothetical protein